MQKCDSKQFVMVLLHLHAVDVSHIRLVGTGSPRDRQRTTAHSDYETHTNLGPTSLFAASVMDRYRSDLNYDGPQLVPSWTPVVSCFVAAVCKDLLCSAFVGCTDRSFGTLAL